MSLLPVLGSRTRSGLLPLVVSKSYVVSLSGTVIVFVLAPVTWPVASDPIESKTVNVLAAVSYTHLTLPTNREV